MKIRSIMTISLLLKDGNPCFFMEMDSMGHQESETAGCLMYMLSNFLN